MENRSLIHLVRTQPPTHLILSSLPFSSISPSHQGDIIWEQQSDEI